MTNCITITAKGLSLTSRYNDLGPNTKPGSKILSLQRYLGILRSYTRVQISSYVKIRGLKLRTRRYVGADIVRKVKSTSAENAPNTDF